MKYLKRFNETISIYNPEWENLLPKEIIVYKGQDWGIDALTYKKGNIMLNADMLQITYDINKWGAPDTLEIDIYFAKDDAGEEHTDSTIIMNKGTIDYERGPGKIIRNLRMDIDITFGDMMACEFSITRKGVSLIQDTSYGSKFDPTNTIFAIEDKSLSELVNFFNRFNIGADLTIDDFYFLREK